VIGSDTERLYPLRIASAPLPEQLSIYSNVKKLLNRHDRNRMLNGFILYFCGSTTGAGRLTLHRHQPHPAALRAAVEQRINQDGHITADRLGVPVLASDVATAAASFRRYRPCTPPLLPVLVLISTLQIRQASMVTPLTGPLAPFRAEPVTSTT
jgi:hypothetical protein